MRLKVLIVVLVVALSGPVFGASFRSMPTQLRSDRKYLREAHRLVRKLYPRIVNGIAYPPSQRDQQMIAQDLIRIASRSAVARRAVIAALIGVLKDESAWAGHVPHTWLSAAHLLARLKATEALDLLIPQLDNPLTPLSVFNGVLPVVRIVSKMGTSAVPSLEPALGDPKPSIRRAAAIALGRIGGQHAEVVLTRALTIEKDDTVLGEIRSALSVITGQTNRSVK